MTRAVVFAYHNVGVRCLKVLLAHGVEVALVVSHQDSPTETIWFDSVAALAELHGIPCITPDDANGPDVLAQIAALAPDFLFSFYYRQMLRPALLALANRGAYNMHGSLLPKYRGRVPVNWAVLRGERETGATLHTMVEKPDAGEIVGQQAVPILPDDTAKEVFDKVTLAAEICLDRVLPALIAGAAPHVPQDLSQGSYFGGRKPEDGRIDWSRPAVEVHNLVRAVAPPYPGAFCDLPAGRLKVLATQPLAGGQATTEPPSLFVRDGHLLARCGDGRLLRLIAVEFDSQVIAPSEWQTLFGEAAVPVPLSPPPAL
jgi:methionyl-tRNA formyltransferase